MMAMEVFLTELENAFLSGLRIFCQNIKTKARNIMYIYPDNLKAKAALWLWQLRDVAIFSSGLLISVFAVAQLGTLMFALRKLEGAQLCCSLRFVRVCDAEDTRNTSQSDNSNSLSG